ncbi:MAG: glycosyltransferase family 2 protein [Actinomycetota bacterium]
MALTEAPASTPLSTDTRPAEPTVSIAIPMLNESKYIVACLDSFKAQDYPLDRLDVMVIDGGSDDGCRLVVEAYSQLNPWVRIVENPKGSASAAFNTGMNQARGEIVCLFSAHGVADPTFVSASVAALHRSGADGVGGSYRHEGLDRRQNAIGAAMVSPVGMASPHRFATKPRDVDTISHPVYWRDAMLDTGGFDEGLARNSDYEFNYRMRAAGYRLHLDPAIGSVYRPRPNLNALFRQFWFYGKWKARVAQHHPGSLQPRHLVAPLAALAALVTPLLVLHRSLRWVAAAGWTAYAALVAFGVVKADPKGRDASIPTLAVAFPTMHLAWGGGFLKSVFEFITKGAKQ